LFNYFTKKLSNNLKKLLIVVATEVEVLPNFRRVGNEFYSLEQYGIHADVLITGPGSVPTTFALSRVADSYDVIINAGIAGSFTQQFPLGSVLLVDSDSFADYGVDDNGTFRHIDNVLPHTPKLLALSELVNPYQLNVNINLERVKGITVSTVSGSMERISFIKNIWNAQVETMESAAVFYTCIKLSKPFFCLRAISNYVELRNRKNWQIDLAVRNLWVELLSLASTLNSI
jgi:futalosine hydrolase